MTATLARPAPNRERPASKPARSQPRSESVVVGSLRHNDNSTTGPARPTSTREQVAWEVLREARENGTLAKHELHLLDDSPYADPTWRTLADINDDPPQPLLLGMFEPDGPTAMNASGGTGKGTTVAWAIHELQKLGMRPMIYDAENHPREWARRTSGLGVNRSGVVYLQPGDLPKSLLGQPLWDVAPYLGKVVKRSGSDILFIDSIMPAVGVGEERLKSDGRAPYLYVNALDELLIPSVSLSHPPKGQPNGDPFGSVAWVNAMRLTWQGTSGEGSGHRVRWRSRKKNERGHIPGVLLTFEYDMNGRLSSAIREDDDEATRDWLLGALNRNSYTIPTLRDLLIDELDDDTTEEHRKRIDERLGRALRRMKKDGFVYAQGKVGRADMWHLGHETKP